jgi:hypothetical protein
LYYNDVDGRLQHVWRWCFNGRHVVMRVEGVPVKRPPYRHGRRYK